MSEGRGSVVKIIVYGLAYVASLTISGILLVEMGCLSRISQHLIACDSSLSYSHFSHFYFIFYDFLLIIASVPYL